MMQFQQRCLRPTVLQNKLVVTGMTHLMLGWRALMKLVLGNLMHIGKDLQAHEFRYSFHPGVFQGIDFDGEREVC
jgi:UV DNA damage repair endonuclease